MATYYIATYIYTAGQTAGQTSKPQFIELNDRNKSAGGSYVDVSQLQLNAFCFFTNQSHWLFKKNCIIIEKLLWKSCVRPEADSSRTKRKPIEDL